MEDEVVTTEKVDTEAETEVETEEDEFERDEDGNIIIPEVDFSEDEEEEEADQEEGGEEATDDGHDDHEELAALRAKLSALERQSRDTLKKLGVEDDDIVHGLASLAAGAADKDVDDYLKERKEEEEAETAKAVLRQQEFERLAAADLAELHSAYPETTAYKHIKDMPIEVAQKFAKFRDAGLTAKEAYAAANPDGVRSSIASSVKKQTQHASKSHLSSVTPKAARDVSVTMTKREIAEWRDLFPGMSDKEILALYRKTKD
jgi:hypothetical protein